LCIFGKRNANSRPVEALGESDEERERLALFSLSQSQRFARANLRLVRKEASDSMK
jgi:hypothetical protein